jgi:dienelactone hydrolase
MGPLPGAEKRPPLEIRVEEETDCGDHLRRLISYQSEPGNRVPAYLLIPKSALEPSPKPHPAVLCLHPTDQELGAKVVIGFGNRSNRAYALELTRRGFVTLAPAYPHLAGYTPDLEKLGYQSGTMKAIWDNIRGLDVLESLPYVKRDGFGAVGHSLGGHNAIFTAVFDPRIRVVVSSCGFDSFQDYYSGDPKVWQPGKGWTQHRYMTRLATYAGRLREIPFDFHELIAALAPRHVFVNAPTGDTNFQWQSVDRIVAAAKPVFRLHGADERLEVVHPDSGHDFPQSARERAYQLFEELLR